MNCRSFGRGFLRLVIPLLVSGGLLVVFAGTALAHAKVVSATPGIGSTITTAPTRVTVTTTEGMNPDPKQSYLQVYGPNGELVSQGDSKVTLSNPKELSVSLKPTGNGVYVVRWATLSADDNEADEGAFVFTVNPTATKTPTTQSGVQTPTNTNGGGVALWVPIVAAVLALLIGGGAGLALGRRRTTSSSLGAMRQAITEQPQGEGPSEEKHSPN